MKKNIRIIISAVVFLFLFSTYSSAVESFSPERTLDKSVITAQDLSPEESGASIAKSEETAAKNTALLLSATQTKGNNSLERIEYTVREKSIVVSLFFSSSNITYKKTQIQYPPWLVVDFQNCKNDLSPRHYSVNSEFLTDIRTSQLILEPPTARVVFHLTQILPVSFDKNGKILKITFLLPERPVVKKEKPLPSLPKSMPAKKALEKEKEVAKAEEFLPKEEMEMAQKEFDEYLQTLIQEKKKLYRGQTPPEVPEKETELELKAKATKTTQKETVPKKERALREKLNDLISMNFKDADLETVLELLAKEKGLNIISTEKIHGTISVNFDKVPLRDAFISILKANGYSYVVEDNIMRIINLRNPKDVLESRVFSTKYIAADAIIPSLKGLLTPQGKIEPFYPYNAVKIRAQGLNPPAFSNKFIVTDVAPVLEQVAEILKEIDKKPAQLALEITVVASNAKNDTELGVEWPISLALGSAAIAESTQENVVYPRAGMLRLGYLTNNEYNVLMNFVKLDNSFKIDSKSKLMCFSDQVTDYKLTQKILLNNGKSVEVGTFLTFIPRVRGDEVIIDLLPIFRELTGFQELEGHKQPVISESKATTKVILKNGEGLILSGLERKRTIIKKGLLNMFDKSTVINEQLLVFIHPVILQSEK